MWIAGEFLLQSICWNTFQPSVIAGINKVMDGYDYFKYLAAIYTQGQNDSIILQGKKDIIK